MGGAPCKVVIDNANAEGMLLQLGETLRGINSIIAELDEYITPKEREEALALSYETCEFAENVVQPFNKKLTDFYIKVSKKHAGHYGEGDGS